MRLKIKYLLVIGLLLLGMTSFASVRTGTIISAPVTVGDSANTFGTLYADEMIGGYKVATDEAERLAITSARRVEGMPCYQVDSGIMYRLVGGIANSNWQVASDLNYVTKSNVTQDFTVNSLTGSDETGTGTAISPWKTINYALSQIPEVLEHDYVINLIGSFEESVMGTRLGLDKTGEGTSRGITLTFRGQLTEDLAEQTSTSGTTTTLTVSGSTWVVDSFKGKIVEFLSGGIYTAVTALGAAPYAIVKSNTNDTITFQNIANVTWAPPLADHFRIITPATTWNGAGNAYALFLSGNSSLNLVTEFIDFSGATSSSIYYRDTCDSKVQACRFLGEDTIAVLINDASHFQWFSGLYFNNASMDGCLRSTRSNAWATGIFVEDVCTSANAIQKTGGGNINLSGVNVEGGTYGLQVSEGSALVLRGNSYSNCSVAGLNASGAKAFIQASFNDLTGEANALSFSSTNGGVIKTAGQAVGGTTIFTGTGDGSWYDTVTGLTYKNQNLINTGQIITGTGNVLSSGDYNLVGGQSNTIAGSYNLVAGTSNNCQTNNFLIGIQNTSNAYLTWGLGSTNTLGDNYAFAIGRNLQPNVANTVCIGSGDYGNGVNLVNGISNSVTISQGGTTPLAHFVGSGEVGYVSFEGQTVYANQIAIGDTADLSNQALTKLIVSNGDSGYTSNQNVGLFAESVATGNGGSLAGLGCGFYANNTWESGQAHGLQGGASAYGSGVGAAAPTGETVGADITASGVGGVVGPLTLITSEGEVIGIRSVTTGGNGTNSCLYLKNDSLTGTNWSIFSSGETDSYFQGQVGVGTGVDYTQGAKVIGSSGDSLLDMGQATSVGVQGQAVTSGNGASDGAIGGFFSARNNSLSAITYGLAGGAAGLKNSPAGTGEVIGCYMWANGQGFSSYATWEGKIIGNDIVVTGGSDSNYGSRIRNQSLFGVNYGLSITMNDSGTGDSFALYVDSNSTSTGNAWSYYQADTANNYFGGKTHINSAQKIKSTKITGATYTIKADEFMLLVNTSEVCTVIIPTSFITDKDRIAVIKDFYGTSGNILITGEGGALIDGEISYTTSTTREAVNIHTDGNAISIY